MKTGKITAKLRDMAPVSFVEDGKEVHRYANIEIPDSIKKIEMQDFDFVVLPDGKIFFEIQYADGMLPKEFPEPRARKNRANDSSFFAAMLAKETAKIPRWDNL